MPPSPSRRDFLATSGTALGAWIAFNLPAIEAAAGYARTARERGQRFRILTFQEARDLEALAEQIIPATGTPGATDAGVVHFMDRALETFAAPMLDGVREGMTDLTARARQRHGSAATFAGLNGTAQAALIREIEQTAFFESVHYLTAAGMFTEPSYGGNRGGVGWGVIGLEMRASFQPPFGYYDRESGESGR